MIPSSDTIAAIATAPGRGGIGVVRLSGAMVPAIAAALLGRVPQPRLATLASFRDAAGAPIDQGLALYFAAPRSYTGEHALELHGHGGSAVLQLLLRRCVELGARLAAPGEFTQRAFLNGKLDLAQAEAVADLIDAATTTAARAAMRSLTGVFSREIDALVAELTELRALTEASLDFPDEDIEFVEAAGARERVAALVARVKAVLQAARAGALLRDGLTVVLVGEPNVGKSSLLNCLAGEDAAIVSAIPGTTRDAIERAVEIAGIPLTIVDTAGLRPTDDPIEMLGIERTWASVRRADLALVLVDARAKGDAIGAYGAEILAQLPAELPRIVVHNKIDLTDLAPRLVAEGWAPERGSAAPADSVEVWLSARIEAGVDLLRTAVLRQVGAPADYAGTFLARERHLVALREAQAGIAAAGAQLQSAAPALELFAEELRRAQVALAAITGEVSADDLLGAIFARFCIGK